MGLKDCEIQLDNPWNTYYSGQTVNGNVRLSIDSPKTIRGIVIRFMGEANTNWSETKKVTDEHGKEHEETENLSGHEEYFEIHYYLVGSKSGAEVNLPAGTHTYPFTCALPPTLPSSFEGEWGHVRYTIKVTLDRPWKFDQDTKMAFTVISPIDLNLNPRVKEPFKLELEKTFCCFCCASGPLTAIVALPATGFVSGQGVPIRAEVDNASDVEVNRLKLTLRKIVTFYTNQPRRDIKKDKVVISELSVGPVAPRGSNTWDQTLNIPPLPPSNLVNCGLIDLDYELKVELSVAGMHKDLEGRIPIVLGTIPLTSLQVPNTAPYTDVPQTKPNGQDPSNWPTQPVTPATPESPPAASSGPAANGQSNLPGWNSALYPNIPPPTYNESQYGNTIVDKNDSQYTRLAGGDAPFAPRYPTYNFGGASAPPNPPNSQ